MKRQWLHDLAKIAAGLVAADFVVLWWYSTQAKLPASFLGLSLSKSMLVPTMVVDIFIFLILVHYAWHIGKIPQIKERFYMVVVGALFTVIALGHVLRVIYGADVSVFGWDVPIFVSWIGTAVAAYLAYTSFHLAGRIK